MHANRGFDENTLIFVTAQIVTPNGGTPPAWVLATSRKARKPARRNGFGQSRELAAVG